MTRGTNLKWLQNQGGWASAKMLLDTYGHFIPDESQGYADALTTTPGGPIRSLVEKTASGQARRSSKSRAPSRSSLARPVGLEPTTCGLEVRCSIQLSYGRSMPVGDPRGHGVAIRARRSEIIQNEAGPHAPTMIIKEALRRTGPAMLLLTPNRAGVKKRA